MNIVCWWERVHIKSSIMFIYNYRPTGVRDRVLACVHLCRGSYIVAELVGPIAEYIDKHVELVDNVLIIIMKNKHRRRQIFTPIIEAHDLS